MDLFAGIEAGGTKIRCAIGDSHGKIIDQIRFETKPPAESIPEIIGYLRHIQSQYPFKAIGIGTFGPLCLDKNAPKYGHLYKSPKLDWVDFNFVGALKDAFQMPTGFDTDVNAAVIAEWLWGAGRGYDHVTYLTIGTGIGGGAIINGTICHGAMHPEMGHIFVPHDTEKDPFKGVCPYHQHCLEGLASGPALKERWQVNSALDLPPEHEAWDLEANYLGYALANYIFSFSPECIILGGGVMKQTHLFPKIRKKVNDLLQGFVHHHLEGHTIDDIIVPPELGQDAGLCGAIALAVQEYETIALQMA